MSRSSPSDEQRTSIDSLQQYSSSPPLYTRSNILLRGHFFAVSCMYLEIHLTISREETRVYKASAAGQAYTNGPMLSSLNTSRAGALLYGLSYVRSSRCARGWVADVPPAC